MRQAVAVQSSQKEDLLALAELIYDVFIEDSAHANMEKTEDDLV